METLERTKPLHNFTLPDDLRWGNTRHLRCIKLQNYHRSNSTSHKHIKPNNHSDKPSNLRTRRSAFKNDFKFDSVSKKTLENSNGENDDDDVDKKKVEKERVKFSVSLSKKEMEDDFAQFGQRLHRRPKKRLRAVQKQLDTLFPGLWLKEVTADMYKVVEAAP